jgi:hypothetical protein
MPFHHKNDKTAEAAAKIIMIIIIMLKIAQRKL